MDGSVPPVDILAALRAATSQAHQQLEASIQIEACVADRGRYARLLRSFYGFYRPLEDRLFALDGWTRCGVDLPSRRKAPWLTADLQALGLGTGEIGALPICAKLPAAHDHAQGFGCLYVLEGATLGGRQITALLQSSPVPANARHFFSSYGSATGARWREFIVSLQKAAEAADETGRAEIVTAAQQTFTCLQEWIVEGCSHHEHSG